MPAVIFKAALSSAYVLASLMHCPQQPPARVTLDVRNNPPAWHNDKSMAGLEAYKPDTVFSRGPKEVFMMGGVTESKIEHGFRVGYRALTHPKSRETCVWVEKVDISLVYSPVVHVASEFTPGSCNHEVTAQHELRHVNTDVITINEYAPKIKAGVEDMVRTLSVQGPVPESKAESARDLLAAVIRAEIERQGKAMEAARAQRQQQIDTRQEYLRLSRACPPEKIKKR